MGNNWDQGTLGDVAEFIMGQSPSGETCNGTGTGVPLLNGPTEFGGSHPQPVQFTTAPRKFAEAGDLLFCVRGSTTGRMNWADRRYAIGRGLAAIRPKNGLEYRHFVRAIIDSYLPRLLASATGSTFPNVSREQIGEIKCCIPPLAEQKAIAEVLGALDDKIGVNRRMNATLEAMARALFQSWFVDFDPVRAKLDGRKPTNIDPATAALFPEHFEHEVGNIVPKGWGRMRWGDIATLEYGKSLREYRENGGKYRVFGTNGPIGFHDKPLCDSPGIVIGRKGAYRGVHFSPDPFFVIDTAFYLKPTTALNLQWAYYELIRFDINSMDSGSAIPSTSREDFYGIPVVFPPKPIQEAFGKIVSAWFTQIFENDKQSLTLAALRDTLLPKLLSGELRVAKVESKKKTAA